MGGELYGLASSNRTGTDLWGKNQFNSTFPMALCSYMRDLDILPIYISFTKGSTFQTDDETKSIEDVFGTGARGGDIRFEFETHFEPIRHLFSDDTRHKIDVVTLERIGDDWEPRRALEVKLTVVPDNSTFRKEESEWSAEIVVRPVSSAYAMLLLWDRLPPETKRTLRSLVRVYDRIQSWEDKQSMLTVIADIHETMYEFATICNEYQEPFLVQPIWKTESKSPELAENCFDVFVWSDLAIVMLPCDQAVRELDKAPEDRDMTRVLREVARHMRCIVELSHDRFVYDRVYGGMSYTTQTDKAFSITGVRSIEYLRHDFLENPRLKTNILPDIILHGGEKELSPERRLDSTIYFRYQDLIEKHER